MNTHYNHEKQFLCQFCDKTFGAAFSLTQHQEGTYHGGCRWTMYKNTSSDRFLSEIVQLVHDEVVDLEIGQRCRTKCVVEKILTTILRHEGNRGRFSLLPDQEGSNKTRLKVGIPDEFDYSVSLLLTEQPKLSCEALEVRYEDDIDFAHVSKARRRFDRYRPLRNDCRLQNLSDGYVGVKPQGKDLRLFRQSIMETSLIPYELLQSFHSFFQKAVDERGFGNAHVSVNRLGNGPAIALTIKHEEFRHNISVDITPKIYIDKSLADDYDWPRDKTKRWLSDEQIDKVNRCRIYLVPKGDKYWKISFADCENKLLQHIDDEFNGNDETETVRKTILRIFKKMLMTWKSKSSSGLKGISSYLLKMTLLWLCENLPHKIYWEDSQIAARLINFLMELKYCLQKRNLKEYFNTKVNLLEGKDEESIEELIGFLEEDIKIVCLWPEIFYVTLLYEIFAAMNSDN